LHAALWPHLLFPKYYHKLYSEFCIVGRNKAVVFLFVLEIFVPDKNNEGNQIIYFHTDAVKTYKYLPVSHDVVFECIPIIQSGLFDSRNSNIVPRG
jgi:hypothetical protein